METERKSGPGGPKSESAPPVEAGHEGYARSSVRDQTARVKQRAGEKSAELKEAAGQKAEELKDTAVRKTDELTSRMGGRIETVARALRRAGDDMRSEGEPRFGDMTHDAAGRVERFGSYLERQNPHEMMADLERSARNHPAYFVAGSFAVGLLMGRFLRSREPEAAGSRDTHPGGREADRSSDSHLEDGARNQAFGEAP